MAKELDKVPVQSISRAARVLRILAESSAEGASLTDIAKRSGLGKATTHRILAALNEETLTYQDLSTRHYHLGGGITLLARNAAVNEIGAVAQPSLIGLAKETGDTSYLLVREGLRCLCLGRMQGTFPIQTLSLNIGQSRPLGVGSGSLAILASLPETEIRTILEENARWLEEFPNFAADKLWDLIALTRKHGYAVVEGLMTPGINAIAVPILSNDGRPIGALSITAISERVQGERVGWLAELLSKEAHNINNMLGRSKQSTNFTSYYN